MISRHICRYSTNSKPCMKEAPHKLWYITMNDRIRCLWYCDNHARQLSSGLTFKSADLAAVELVSRRLLDESH